MVLGAVTKLAVGVVSPAFGVTAGDERAGAEVAGGADLGRPVQ